MEMNDKTVNERRVHAKFNEAALNFMERYPKPEGGDYEDAQEWARSVIAKDKARELRDKDIRYIDIK